MKNRRVGFLLQLKNWKKVSAISIAPCSMNQEESCNKVKVRIIEIDRKIASQLADVWIDMKDRILRGVASKHTKPQSKLRKEIKQD